MIALAAETGVAPSVLLGRVVGPADPAWTELDLEQVLGFRREKAKVCTGCGTRPQDWYEPDGRTLLNPPPFEPVAVRDPGCEATERFRKTLPEGEFGLAVELVPFDPSKHGDEG